MDAPMWRLTVSLLLAAPTVFARAPKPPATYPDLSDPKAAAFSLGVALAKGDAKTARTIYIGGQKDFFRLLDALAKAAASARKFSRAVTARYGENAATLTLPAAGLEPKLKLGGSGSNVPLTSLIAVADEKVRGKEATLVLGPSVEIHLRKKDQGWKVISFPSLPPELVDFANTLGSVYEELAGEIEKGKYKKAHEVYAALGRALGKRLAEMLKDGE